MVASKLGREDIVLNLLGAGACTDMRDGVSTMEFTCPRPS